MTFAQFSGRPVKFFRRLQKFNVFSRCRIKNTLETLLKVAKIEGEIDRSERKPRTKKLEKSKKVTEVTLVVAYFLPLDKMNNFCLNTIVVSLQPVAKTSSEP